MHSPTIANLLLEGLACVGAKVYPDGNGLTLVLPAHAAGYLHDTDLRALLFANLPHMLHILRIESRMTVDAAQAIVTGAAT